MHHIKHMIEVRTHDIHLIDIYHAGDIVMVSLSPNCFGLRLDTALGAEDRNAAVQHSQGALDLGGKVHMTRSVDDVDAGVPPMAGSSGGGYRYASLLLLLHPVHGCGTFMSLTKLVIHAGVEKNTLSSRSLSGVNVSHDTDISRFLK